MPENAEKEQEKAEKSQIQKARLSTLKSSTFECVKVGPGFLSNQIDRQLFDL